MKILKLFASAIIAASMTVFAACSSEASNESSSDGTYRLVCKNDSEQEYIDKCKVFNEEGAAVLVRLSFEKNEEYEESDDFDNIGVIFDYRETDIGADFYLLRVERNGRFSIFRYRNITDLDAIDFGAKYANYETISTSDSKEAMWYNAWNHSEFSNFNAEKKEAYFYICEHQDSDMIRFKICALTSDEYNSITEVQKDTGKIRYLKDGEIKDADYWTFSLLVGVPSYAGKYTWTTGKAGVWARVEKGSTVRGSWDMTVLAEALR